MALLYMLKYAKRRSDRRYLSLKRIVDVSLHHRANEGAPSVSIIIPTRDKFELLRACIESIIEKTNYPNYQICVVDNQSKDVETLEYLGDLARRGVTVLTYNRKFNYSAICNYAAGETGSELLCFLNNDTEVCEPNWLESLVKHATEESVGVVGCMLTYGDKRIQHAGIALGYTGLAGHPYSGEFIDKVDLPDCFQVSGVTFACAVISKTKFNRIGKLDENLPVGLNDVDFCLRSSEAGFVNVICRKSYLVHHESKTRKSVNSLSGGLRAVRDVMYVSRKYKCTLDEDLYFLP